MEQVLALNKAMALRKELNLFTLIFVLKIFDILSSISPLKPERISGVDFLVVRELTGEIYFGDHILDERKARDINDYSAMRKWSGLFAKPLKLQNRRKFVTSISISKMF